MPHPRPHRCGIAAAALAAVVLPQQVSAQVADVGAIPVAEASATETWRFTVGLGAAVFPDYAGSNNYTVGVLPRLRAEKGTYNVDVYGPLISSNVLPSRTWQFGPAGQYIRGSLCNSNDNVVNNMHCLSDSFMFGAGGGYTFRLSEASRLTPKARLLFDVTGASDGYTFEPQIEYGHRLSPKWQALGVANLLVSSDGFQSYYFGIDSPQARRSGLRRYNADGGVQQFGLTAIGRYSIDASWSIDLLGRYQRLVGDAADSPLVNGTSDSRGDANQFTVGVVGAFHF